MSLLSILRSAAGAALLANAVPHAVQGYQGKQFPTPFADPPGEGMSGPLENIGWSAINTVAGAWVLRRGIHTRGEGLAAAIGAVGMAGVLVYHFGDVLRGGRGLRGLRGVGATRSEAGPRRALITMTEPIANALAGRSWFPLWAVVHHQGRRSGAHYATPVAVIPTTDSAILMIGLPWGAETNWSRNVLASDGATIGWRGKAQSTTSPRVIDPAEAYLLAKRPFGSIVKRMPAAIVLRRTPPATGTDLSGSGSAARPS